MEISTIIPHIEALVFASDKPLTALEVTEYVNNALGFIEDRANLDQVESAIEGIKEKYDSEFYAFELKQSGGGWQFLTKPEYHKTVALINGDKFIKKLSTASLETLAIIAYKQPITKSEIESIRGVNCDYAVQKLLEKDLVIISGRNEDAVGKPLIYNTSKSFMDYFGINSADELPKISEVLMEQFEQATTMSDILAANAAEAEEKERENRVDENFRTQDEIIDAELKELNDASEEEIVETGIVISEETVEEEIIETGVVVNEKMERDIEENEEKGEEEIADEHVEETEDVQDDKKEEGTSFPL